MSSGGMRVLALLTDCFGAGGGIAQYNRDLVTALSQSGTVSRVVALPRYGHWDGLLPHKVEQKAPRPSRIRWIAAALQLARREHFDTVVCGHLNAVPLAAAVARLKRARLWVQVHGTEAWQPAGFAVRQGLGAAQLVTSVSRYTRRRLLAWADIRPETVRVLPNTFAADFAPASRSEDLAARHRLEGKRVVLTVGRLAASERYKGHDRVISAMRAVLARIPETIYLIVGSGDDEPRLRELAQREGVSSSVVFAGQVPASELPGYFALADVFAMPSTGEGFGIVFLEAAASGLPVIAGNADGSADPLADGAIGRLVDPQSSTEIVGALVDALHGRAVRDPARVQRFAFSNFAAHVDLLARGLAAAPVGPAKT